jgi:WD40 repeat protein
MNEQDSFFTSGGTLGRTAPSYVTRHADDDIVSHLLNGDFCYVLTSRQMGKSSLMVRTADRLRKDGVHVAILDLTRIGQNVTIEQWYDGLLVRLGSDLDLEDELDDFWTSDEQSRVGPMQRFMLALRKIVLPAKAGKIAIFIDEIDAVRSLPFSSDEFFAGIREFYNGRVHDPELNRLAFCLLGVAQPSDLISNVYITPFNIGHRIELTDFSEKEAQPLLDGLLPRTSGRSQAEAVLRRVLYWTGGHPYLTQKLCETVGKIEGGLTVKHVDQACDEMFLSTRSREQQDNLIFVRDRVLASKENRAAILDLYERVLRGEKVKDDDSNTTIDPLRLSGLLLVANGFLRVRNRIYARVFDRGWIAANMPDAELRRQKAAFRRGIVQAAALALPVLAVIAGLGIAAVRMARGSALENYYASASSAQEAFNVGDYATGRHIMADWDPHRSESALDKVEYWVEGRNALEESFAMRLLRSEAKAGGSMVLKSQHPGSDGAKTSACGVQTTVAATSPTYGGRPLVAAAGSDASVQIWYADSPDPKPFRELQLRIDGDQLKAVADAPLSCAQLKEQANTLPGIMALSFSPDGQYLAMATGSWNSALSRGFVLLWKLDGSNKVIQQVSFGGTADAVRFSSDGKYLVASSEDLTAKVWQIADGVAHDVVTVDPRMLKSPRGGSVGSGANTIAVSSPMPTDGKPCPANAPATPPIGEHLMAIGYGDGHLVIYDYTHPESAKPLYVGIAQVSGLMSATFLVRRCRALSLVVGSRDGEMLMLDPVTLIKAFSDGKGNPDAARVQDAVRLTLNLNQGMLLGLTAGYDAQHDRTWMLTSGSAGTAELWAMNPNFHLLMTMRGHSGPVNGAAFCQTSPDAESSSDCIVTASTDATVRIWRHPFRDASRGEGHLHVSGRGLSFPGQMLGVSFLPGTGKELVTVVGATTEEHRDHSEVVATWEIPPDIAMGKQPEEYVPATTGEPLLGAGVSPDGRFVVSTSRDRELSFVGLDQKTAATSGLVKRNYQQIDAHVALSPKIAVRCLTDDGRGVLRAELGDPHGGCKVDQRDYLVMSVADKADVGDGSYGQGEGLCMFHIVDRGPATPENATRFSVAAGNLNPCETPSGAASWPANEQELRGLLRQVSSFDISNDGGKLAVSLNRKGDTIVGLWTVKDLLNGKADHVESKNFPSVFASMLFSPDGDELAAVDISAQFYFWSVSDTKRMPEGAPASLHGRAQSMAFAPDGKTLAIGMQDARIMIWDVLNGRTVMTVREHLGGISGLAFSPDGSVLLSSGNGGQVKVMQAASQ